MVDNLHQHIDELVAEEHKLRSGTERTAADRERLRQLEVQLDQAWDLLRQRDAKRAVGEDPGQVDERPAGQVEGYLQ